MYLLFLIIRFFDFPSIFIHNPNNPIFYYTSLPPTNMSTISDSTFIPSNNEYGLFYPLTSTKDNIPPLYTLLYSIIPLNILPIVSSLVDLYLSMCMKSNKYFILTSFLPADLTSLEFIFPSLFLPFNISILPAINPFWFVRLNIFKQYETLFMMLYRSLFVFIVVVLSVLKSKNRCCCMYGDSKKGITGNDKYNDLPENARGKNNQKENVRGKNNYEENNYKENNLKEKNHKKNNIKVNNCKENGPMDNDPNLCQSYAHNYVLYISITSLMFSNSTYKHLIFYFTMNNFYFFSSIFLVLKEYFILMLQCSPVVNLNFVNWMDFLFFVGIGLELFIRVTIDD